MRQRKFIGSPDSGETAVSGENDLAAVYPLGTYDGRCCDCAAHRTKEGTQSAELVYGSGRLALHADASKASAFGGTAQAGVPVYVEGMPAATGVCRRVRLRTDVLVPGVFALSLSGDAGFRVWSDASGTNAAPLLVCGQTATNGVNGVSFLSGDDSDLFVEAVSNGTATLTYTFTGTGDAAGLSCSASLKMTAWNVGMAMDGDRDGGISFDGTNDTSYVFWVNDDVDKIENGEEDDAESGQADCSDGAISCMRDLEDFARLHIRIGADVSCLSNVTYSLKFANVTDGTPMVNVFEAVDETDDYLSDTNSASLQIQKTSLTPDGVFTTEVPLGSQYVKTGGEVSPFLIEGCAPGAGDLTLIVKKDGAEICRKAVRLELHDISWFYDIWLAQILSGERWEVQVGTTATHSQTAQYQPKTDEKLLFIHGWNMPEWEKRRWTETMFKRLWWQGYKGSVALFDWPTLYDFSGFWDVVTNPHHFDNSEYISWQSADALTGVFNTLNADGQLSVLAHSMGNVVTAEALRKYTGPQIKAYIAAQAAISAQYYDGTTASREPAQGLNGADTPDVIGHYSTNGNANADSYMSGVLSAKAGNAVSYNNFDDYALKKWCLNNNLKPDGASPYHFQYSGSLTNYTEGTDEFYRQSVIYVSPHQTQHLMDETERYRIFAYCAESRSCALGQATNMVSGITEWDLHSGMGYDWQHYSHSREFRSNVAAENTFWLKVTDDCK